MAEQFRDIRPSPIVGAWYTADARRLAQEIDDFIRRAEVSPVEGRVVGLLAPHAGHRYSGAVAGYAFKLLDGYRFDTVVLIGPLHSFYPAPIVTSAHDSYRTPLGLVPVDHALLGALSSKVPLQFIRHDREHSLEIELPFLQRQLGTFQLVPLSMVDQSLAMAEQLGHALSEVLAGRNALLVASSDLSHYQPEPIANTLDQTMLEAVAAFDPARVIRLEEEARGFACGRGAIAAVMIAARSLGANRARVLHYATSGKVTRDFSQVVGYGAAVFYRADTGSPEA